MNHKLICCILKMVLKLIMKKRFDTGKNSRLFFLNLLKTANCYMCILNETFIKSKYEINLLGVPKVLT